MRIEVQCRQTVNFYGVIVHVNTGPDDSSAGLLDSVAGPPTAGLLVPVGPNVVHLELIDGLHGEPQANERLNAL